MRPLRRAPTRGERAFLAGSDGVLFGILVLVAGTLLVVDGWRVVDRQVAVRAAAQEYLRTYTEQPDAVTARARADAAARRLLRDRGTPIEDLRIVAPPDERFGPCSVATVLMRTSTPGSSLPFLRDLVPGTLTVRMSEVVDPHRELLAGRAHDLGETPCG